MRIEAHVILRNEAPILPYFLRHYSTFCSRIFAYDDRSDDGTREMLKEHPLVVLGGTALEGLDDESFTTIYGNARHLSPLADWIICVDADEFVYHPWIVNMLLQVPKEFTVLVPVGFDMISDHFPTTEGQIYEEIKEGVPDARQSKPLMFRPEAAPQFTPGRHTASFNGKVVSIEGLKLLHCRFLGREYWQARHARNYARMSETNKAKGHGVHNTPGWDGIYSERWLEEAKKNMLRVVE